MLKEHFKQVYSQDVRRLASKHNISTKEVVDIYYKQFSFAVKHIREDNKKAIKDRKSIRLQGLGILNFHPIIAGQIEKLKYDELPRIETSSEDGDRDQLDQCND